MTIRWRLLGLMVLLVAGDPAAARPGGDGTPAERAARLVADMSLDEKVSLLHTRFGTPTGGKPAPPNALMSAGVGPGIPRLGIPPLEETDAGLGIADPANIGFSATAMPSTLAIGATFDPAIAFDTGAAIGAEARDRGLGVVLGGGADLVREPRGGRNFEYVSEDPLLTGALAGAAIGGIQSRGLVSSAKHFALNDQENGRVMYSAKLAEKAARESDLLAFEIAIERGRPGAVMTAYNRVDGTWTAQNHHLLSDILKGDWGFSGWVMSDWGGVHATAAAALAGLDQESGEENDRVVFFGAPLAAAVEAGAVPRARLDDMVRRLLTAQIAAGLLDDPPSSGPIRDRTPHAEVAERAARDSIVLLKNEAGALPLAPDTRRILLVGRMADRGVLSGGGSSQVVPEGSIRAEGEPAQLFYGKPKVYHPSSILDALRARLPHADIRFLDGSDVAATVAAARDVDVALVVAEQWSNESLDHPDLALPHGQDATIEAVARAAPRTIVVLQTGGAVAMPWLSEVGAVLEMWYPGERGGPAIADILTGVANPSGRLPVTFPADAEQLPRATIPDHAGTANNAEETPKGPWFTLDYDIEGADVGYKWYLHTKRTPLFPFGRGLSYTSFVADGLKAVSREGTLVVDFDVRNTGAREGTDTPQVYVDGSGFGRRLVGWQRVALAPGETRHVSLHVDPRLLAGYDEAARGWVIAPSRYRVALRPDALADGVATDVDLPAARWPARHGPCGGIPCEGTRKAQQ